MTFKEMALQQADTKFIDTFKQRDDGLLSTLWRNHGPIMTLWFMAMLSTFIGLFWLV